MPGRFAVILILIGMTAMTAAATTIRLIPFDQKVDRAASIFFGKCLRSESRLDPGGRIVTYSTFAVEKMLKGAPAQEATVVLPGGTIGDVRTVVIGTPGLQDGQEYVVFVRNTSAGPTILYWTQGVYSVETDAGGQKNVIPVARGAVLIDTQRGMAVAAEEAMPIAQFESRLRDTISRHEALRMEMVERQRSHSRGLLAVLFDNKMLVLLGLGASAAAIRLLFRR